ncbi:5'-nucleotidase C-terminal domain-containing protein [Nonlabens sp.]|uniref:5'-nucleotidase C-terminal domain-containing protein n=1 Tax=Nonlabens sp. TaxID=1888209 RepID=UPI001BD028F3|nr:5'-nucleotidase [Nonlabens sp.]
MKKYRLENRKGTWNYSAFAKAVVLATIFLVSCNQKEYHLQKVVGSKIAIDSSLTSVPEIEEYIAPFKKSLDVQMNEQLSYNPVSMYKSDYKLNTPIGNMMATIVRTQGAPVYKSRTGKSIDIVLLNNGGIRAGMPAGPVSMRSAYEIMPFDNEIVIAELTGDQVNELINYLIERKSAHPIDGLQILLNEDGTAASVLINDKPLDTNKVYHVATNDYLYNGGDNMSFFKDTPFTSFDYKIRNAMIDYFKKVDTLTFQRDHRFDYAH